MTAGITGITVSTILQQPLPSRFLLTVLEVDGDTAVILVNGKALEVQSEIPLQPGQMLLVSQEQGASGQVRLRVIGEGAAPPGSGAQAAPEAGRQIDLPAALRLAELPATASTANKMAALLKTLGGPSLPNLLAAAAFLKSGLASKQVLDSVASFVTSLLAQRQEGSPGAAATGRDGGKALRQALLARAPGLAEALQLLSAQLGGSQGLKAALQALVEKSGEQGRQTLGGQVYTWAQTDGKGQYLYLPLHAILHNFGLHDCELYIYPPSEEQREDGEQGPWSFTLTLATEALGWMQFKLTCDQRRVAVQALVEQPGTKLALDDNWPLLAAGLGSLSLRLTAQHCELGRVHSQARAVRDLERRFQQFNPFDISI